MAKDAEVGICGHILSVVSCRMERSRKGVCRHGDEFFPLESTRQPRCGLVPPIHHVYWRAAEEECDTPLADALFSGYLLDLDCHFY